jgi:hypothetical protein
MAERFIKVPMPTVAPLMYEMTKEGVREVWDAFVKPDQDSGMPQSVEMRLLMAILRAVNAAEWPDDPARDVERSDLTTTEPTETEETL